MSLQSESTFPSCWNEEIAQHVLQEPSELDNTGQHTLQAHQTWESHLERCQPCRARLEELAGSVEDWLLAKDVLSFDKGFSNLPVQSNVRSHHLIRYVKQHVQPNPSDDPQSLGRLGVYELVGIIGRGGMGIVFKAFDRILNRFVAIKILDPLIADRELARIRFARESRSMASISHEHVVPIYSVDEHRSLPYFVMEYVPGGTLEHRLSTDGPMPTLPWLRVALQIAQGLDAAHRQGLVHRDIKPSNILMDQGVERIRVTDFGLARELDRQGETRSEVLIGTPLYMSPEQVLGEPCDARSDLFSLGSVLFQLATGKPPFANDSIYGTLRSIANETPKPFDQPCRIPNWQQALLLKLLAKNPEDRFANATELIQALSDELVYFQEPSGQVPLRLWQLPNPSPHPSLLPLFKTLYHPKVRLWLAAGVLAIGGAAWWWPPFRSPFSQTSAEHPASAATPASSQRNSQQEPSVPPEVATWRDRIVAILDHKKMAFGLGPELMKINFETSRQAAISAWPNIRSRDTKTGLLKAFQFGEHPNVLSILHLGMTDADPKVRDYANAYLRQHAFQSFEGQAKLYDQWYRDHGTDSLDVVHESGLRDLFELLQKRKCSEGLALLENFDLTWDRASPSDSRLAEIASGLGYGDLAIKWLHENNLDAKQRLRLIRMMTSLKVPLGPREERLFAKWERDEPTVFASTIFNYRAKLDANSISKRLENRLNALLEEPNFEEAKSVATILVNLNDDRAIPLQIAIIDADNAYDTIYGIGYFGLGFGEIGKKTKVRYSKWHDGPWWRRWWEENRERFSMEAQSFPILDLPETPNGKVYRPVPFDIETSDGRQALALQLLEQRDEDWQDVADLFALSNDPRDIPFLIGLLDADNSPKSIYRLSHFGIVPLVNNQGKHQLKYSAYRDGPWWKRWWKEHASDFGPLCASLVVPELKKTPFGKTYQSLPEDLETPDGRRWLIRYELGKPETDLLSLSDFFTQHGDERDLPWLIAIVASDEQLTGKSFLADNAISKLANLQGIDDLGEKDSAWWKNWWRDNHVRYPSAESTLPDIGEWIGNRGPTDTPLHSWTFNGGTAHYFLLGGDDLTAAPAAGFKLLVVLPGGDGGRDFHPFVQNIFRESLDASWLVIQPLTIQWTPDQQIVWPTELSPVKGMKFGTEAMVEGMIADVQKRFSVDPSKIFSMSWSSSGPAAYALSTRPGSSVRGSYIAMSVFKPQFLHNLEQAKNHRFVIEHSPEDAICPYAMAMEARKTLREAGAEISEVDYAGGHGWHGNVFHRIRSALQTLAN